MDFERYYREIAGLTITSVSGDEMHAHCPLHDDKVSSLSINKNTGLWKCFGSCQEGGNVFQFHAKLFKAEGVILSKAKKDIDIRMGSYKVLPLDILTPAKQKLRQHDVFAQFLIHERGLTAKTVEQFSLGTDGDRIWIPIFDEDCYIVNIRKYKPHAKEHKIISYDKGFGSFKLYPVNNIKHDEILLVEGEFDCILANQLGYHAITGTCGAGTFPDEVIPRFAGKIVNICFDIDKAGKEGALKLAKKLSTVAKVKIIELPITDPPNADLSDYVVKYKHTKSDFDELIKKTAYFINTMPVQVKQPDDAIYDVQLNEAANDKYYYKKTRMKVVISGKDLAPYFAPIKIALKCTQGKKTCKMCPISHNNGTLIVEFTLDNNEILELIRCNKAQQQAMIREKLNIPKCNHFTIEVLKIINIEEIRVIPEIDYSAQNTEYVTRQIYYIGYGIQTNKTYCLEGITVPDPKNQYVTQIITNAKPTQSSIDTFKMTPELFNELKIFQTKDIFDLVNKINNINKDLTYNITKIYGREDLITAVDLIYHSALQFKFQNNLVQKGWVEGLIIGDTRCGKTESLIRLIQHYRLGELCTGENISYAGLVGGMSQTQQRWSINWGKIPLNDRRLIVLDEVSSLDVDTISNLSALRSSGIAEIIKIQTERTNARTRLIWVSNPRSGRKLDTYNYGVMAIKELIGKVEDIARFDFAVSVAANEVSIEEINKPHNEQIQHIFTSDICNKLILWCWSRTPEQIIFTPEAETAILKYAMNLGSQFDTAIPLVEGAEERIKLAKMSVAIAGRTFSTEDGERLIVKHEHVTFVYDYLQRIYSKPSMGYSMYSIAQTQATKLTDEQRFEIKEDIKQFNAYKLLIDLLLEYNAFRKGEISDQMGYDLEENKQLFRWLTANRLIKNTPIGYVKQPIFTQLLKEIKGAK